jgi:ATP-dependent DNA ligase
MYRRHIADPEQRDIRDVLFRVACNMNLEGIVSKRLDRATVPESASAA